ncbi:hypothetical protein V2J09_024201 [Rumex salicifolius]
MKIAIKPFVVFFFFVLVPAFALSAHPAGAGGSYRWMQICKEEAATRRPLYCIEPICDLYCSSKHTSEDTHGWGKCNHDNHFVCECFYICYKDDSSLGLLN